MSTSVSNSHSMGSTTFHLYENWLKISDKIPPSQSYATAKKELRLFANTMDLMPCKDNYLNGIGTHASSNLRCSTINSNDTHRESIISEKQKRIILPC